jgi:hypothetical protein
MLDGTMRAAIFVLTALGAVAYVACKDDSHPSAPGPGCTTSADGTCDCSSTSKPPNKVACPAARSAPSLCCGDTDWPADGGCDCKPVPNYSCIVSDDGVTCRCGADIGSRPGEARVDACPVGEDVICCLQEDGCTCAQSSCDVQHGEPTISCGGPVTQCLGGKKKLESCQ